VRDLRSPEGREGKRLAQVDSPDEQFCSCEYTERDILSHAERSPHCRLESMRFGHTLRPARSDIAGGSLGVSDIPHRAPTSRAHDSAFASIIVCEAILIGLWFANHGDVSIRQS
jgi:hypothetical protein